MELALNFSRQAAACTSDAELRAILEAATLDLGFKHFAIVHHVRFSAADPTLLSLDNYSAGWAEEFVGKALFVDDPILLASQRTAKGFAWADVARLLKIQPRHKTVLEKSARYGMGWGFTVPANVPGEPTGSCSFAMRPGKAMSEKILRTAELIAIDASDTARRLRNLPAMGPAPHLSPRELMVASGIASGRSDKLIARHAGISPETVRQYAKTARSAYGARTRSELVSKAHRDGQILF